MVSCNLHLIMSIKIMFYFSSISKDFNYYSFFLVPSSFLYSKEIAKYKDWSSYAEVGEKLGLHGSNKTKKGGGKL